MITRRVFRIFKQTLHQNDCLNELYQHTKGAGNKSARRREKLKFVFSRKMALEKEIPNFRLPRLWRVKVDKMSSQMVQR